MRSAPLAVAFPFALLLPFAAPLARAQDEAATKAAEPNTETETEAERAFAAQLAAILPAEHERGWRSIAWRPELRAAVAEADRAGKPVLLWAMNGHPLGLV